MPLPGKFDDISKTAKSVLDDDYTVKDYKFEVKAKTNLDAAVATVAVDLAKGNPTKVTWKFPKPFGVVGFAIDKFEYDKDGKMKFECATKKELHGVDALTVDAKTDLVAFDKATVGLAYTGIKDAFVKFETKPLKYQEFTCECLYGTGPVVLGAQFQGLNLPTVGVNYTYSGDFFAALVAKKSFSEFSAHVHYKVNPKTSLVAACGMGNKGDISYTFGASGEVANGVKLKAKMDSEQKVQGSCKAEIVKGLILNAGGSYNTKDGKCTYGVKLNVE